MDGTGSEGATSAQGAVNNGSSNSNGSQSAVNTNSSGNTITDNSGVGKSNNNSSSNSNDIEALIQSAVDRATNKLGNENKSLREQLENAKRANMTDAEKHEADMADREAALKQGEAALKAEKNRMYAVGAIKNAGLDDGSTTAMELIDLVMSDDEKGIDKKVTSLKGLVDKLVQTAVNKTFTENGRNPNKGGSSEDDPEKRKTEIGAKFGKRAAQSNKQSRSVLDFYTGGKK